jgi:hypothetical protein
MNKLQDVTLLTFTSVRIDEHISSMNKCVQDIKFGAVKFLSNEKPNNLPEYAEFVKIDPIKDIMDFNRFCFSELYKYVDTSHTLLFQDHAYILNSQMWDNSWLMWDWIGSPWGIVENAYIANNGERARVGNGGFSLRSKRMLELPSKMNWQLREEQGFYNEDGNFCCYYRKEMLENGIQYAPLDVALKFSYENPVPEHGSTYPTTFGFHKNVPLANEFSRIYKLG